MRSLPYHHILKNYLFILAGWVFVVVHGLSLVAVTVGYSLLLSSCFPGGSDGKEPTCNEGDLGSIPGLGRNPGEGNSYPLQYSGLESSMDVGGWQATVHGVAEWDMTATFSFSSCSPQASHSNGFCCCRAWALVCRLSSCGTQA